MAKDHSLKMKSQELMIEQIHTLEDLATLETDWLALQASRQDLPIFLTWEWIQTWWRSFGEGRELWVLVLREQEGEVVGIAPWMRETAGAGMFSIKKISFIGTGTVSPDHLDIITAPGRQQSFSGLLAEHLDEHRSDWNVLDFQSLSFQSCLIEAFSKMFQRKLHRIPLHCPYFELPASWETFEMDMLSSNRRQQLRRFHRKLLKAYPETVTFHQVRELAELDAVFTELQRLHESRWQAAGVSTPFQRKKFVTFHREMAAVALGRDWLRLYTLTVDGNLIAIYYCFIYHKVTVDYQSGFDIEWSVFSPGQLLLAHVIREAIHAGAREFDMLRGSHDYKSSWADQVRKEPHLLFSSGRRGDIWLLALSAIDRARLIGREILPPSVKHRLENLIDRFSR